MMMSNEPMTLGSPQSATSPGGHGTTPFLPPYLMGDQSAVGASPNQSRLWSSSTGSPPRSNAYANRSGNWGGNGTGNTPIPSASHNSVFSQSPRSEVRASGRPKEKPGAPPVQGLLESIHTTPASGRKAAQTNLDISQTGSFRTATGIFSPGCNTPDPMGTPAGSVSFSQPKKTPPSPAQIDPFYKQGESIKPDDELDDTWVTVFGFPPAATSYILQQFSQYGSILKHVIASDGNWMHVHYQSRFQARKALSKNGKIFGGNIMVGVLPCIDKNVMNADKENFDGSIHKTSFLGTPNQSLLQQSDRLNSSARNTPMRPLTAAYKAASSEHEVLRQSNTPQKNTGVITKAMEYVFGW